MTREHRRPLNAYFVLCVATALLLAQSTFGSFRSTAPVQQVLAHAGEPAAAAIQAFTLTVLREFSAPTAPTAPAGSYEIRGEVVRVSLPTGDRAQPTHVVRARKHLANGPGQTRVKARAEAGANTGPGKSRPQGKAKGHTKQKSRGR